MGASRPTYLSVQWAPLLCVVWAVEPVRALRVRLTQHSPIAKGENYQHSEHQVLLQVHPNPNMLACEHAGDCEAGV